MTMQSEELRPEEFGQAAQAVISALQAQAGERAAAAAAAAMAEAGLFGVCVAEEAGGLSGAPLADLALQRVKDFRTASGGRLPLVAAGGIASPEQAWGRIRAGAGLVQIYSAMVYEGPGLAARIASGLEKLAIRDGFARVGDAVGTGGSG